MVFTPRVLLVASRVVARVGESALRLAVALAPVIPLTEDLAVLITPLQKGACRRHRFGSAQEGRTVL